MADRADQRYRLTIDTQTSGTLMAIGASRDEDALTTAKRILASISAPDASFRLQRANGSILSARTPTPPTD